MKKEKRLWVSVVFDGEGTAQYMERSRHAIERKALANEAFAEIAPLVTQKTNGAAYCLSLLEGGGGGRVASKGSLTKATIRGGLL